MSEYKILINEATQRVTFEGLNWGYGLGNTLLLWGYSELSDLIVVKKPGASDWSSRGQSSYTPAEFLVFRIIEKIGAGWLRVEMIIEFPINKPRSES